MELNKIHNGNCLEVLKGFPDNSIDSCVTDPPYGINFMNKHWDYELPSVEVWKEVIRVLKPGGFILCACGTRTQHRMAVNIEDAGFEIRDVITWHYGSGFPKSLDIGKAIDKLQGNEREDLGTSPAQRLNKPDSDIYEAGIRGKECRVTKGNSEYEGWGTALKPATEFWTLARKPLSENTVAENVLKYGTGGINIDGSRIEGSEGDDPRLNGNGSWKTDKAAKNVYEGGYAGEDIKSSAQGRFPANVIFDEFSGKLLDEQTGTLATGNYNKIPIRETNNWMPNQNNTPIKSDYDDVGGASRFFYCPKSDNYERNKGLKGFELKEPEHDFGTKLGEPRSERVHTQKRNFHPTVKPIDLMRYLVKLITPKKGIVLDPFMGSGTTGIGAKMELINYVGIEREPEYCKIAEARINAWNPDKYKPQQLF